MAFNALSRGYAESYGSVLKAEDVAGLGDEAWRLWVEGNGRQVTYHWRRDNLVIEAHVHCYGTCPRGVDAAARSWADAVDAEARKTSKSLAEGRHRAERARQSYGEHTEAETTSDDDFLVFVARKSSGG